MKSVIYKINTFEVVRVAENVKFDDIEDDEDFMPISLWNQSEDKEKFPILN